MPLCQRTTTSLDSFFSCPSVLGIGHLTEFGQRNINRHYTNEDLKVRCVIWLGLLHLRHLPWERRALAAEWKVCRAYLKLDQQPEACSTTPADPEIQEPGTVLRHWDSGVFTGHINPHTELQRSKLSKMIPFTLFIDELIFVFSVEEGFSHISSPWCEDPGLCHWKFPDKPQWYRL